MPSPHEAFREKQDRIYDGIRAAHHLVGVSEGLQPDVTGTQGAFLVAYRHPEATARIIEDLSLSVAALARAIPYRLRDLHVTLSDHGLAPDLVIDPSIIPDHEEMLELLSQAVKLGLDTTDPHSLSDREITLGDAITNGKAVLATGQPNDSLLDITTAVKDASRELGVADGQGLRGSWGTHTTVNRFTGAADIQTARNVRNLLDRTPTIGRTRPTAIDVGYLAVNPDGFTFTTHERFPLDRE